MGEAEKFEEFESIEWIQGESRLNINLGDMLEITYIGRSHRPVDCQVKVVGFAPGKIIAVRTVVGELKDANRRKAGHGLRGIQLELTIGNCNIRAIVPQIAG